MQTPPSPQPAPTLITEQQLEGELGNLVRPNKPAPRGRKIILGLIGAVVLIGALAWATQRFGWLDRATPEDDPFLTDSLDSVAPTLDSSPPASASETETSTRDLTTPTGRDLERRARLDLFVSAARAAEANQVTLPITTTPVKLNDSSSPAVQEIRALLTAQDLTDTEIDGYLLDPKPESYYFGYQYDGVLLTLTAVLEAGGTDCTLTGDLCILKRTIDL